MFMKEQRSNWHQTLMCQGSLATMEFDRLYDDGKEQRAAGGPSQLTGSKEILDAMSHPPPEFGATRTKDKRSGCHVASSRSSHGSLPRPFTTATLPSTKDKEMHLTPTADKLLLNPRLWPFRLRNRIHYAHHPCHYF